MNSLEAWRPDFDDIWDRMAMGLELFGPHANWLWVILIFWVTAATSLWFYTNWQQSRSDRKYLAYASRQLPMLRRIARQRAQEVAFSRRTDRF